MRRWVILATAMLCAIGAAPARGQDAVDFEVVHKLDLMAVRGEDAGQVHALDNLDLMATADLDRLIGWSGGSMHVHVLDNLGGRPNDSAQTLQGVDNIEVANARLRLFEAWFEQAVGARTTVRAGLYDLNSEFYRNDAAGLLIGPAFGIGSEIAATGPNGPSIFPSTALAIRVDHRIGESNYVRGAVLNATAGTLGDVQGVNLSFDDGALLIGEVGREHDGGKLAVGFWGYSRNQDDIRALDAGGAPLRRAAYGGYVVIDQPLGEAVTGFVRIGVSDGRTTPFVGGWQAGVLIGPVVRGREDSQLSVGFGQARLSSGWRANLDDAGTASAPAETMFEISYADIITRHVMLQPDLQLVLNPNGERNRRPALVAGLRMTIQL